METLQVCWYVLIVGLFLVYSILDGFDLGVAIATPWLARTEDEKRILFNSIGPVWDGNEVWLLAGGAALFAAFPPAYATIFSGFYIPLMLILFALIFRAVSLEFHHYDPRHAALWSRAFSLGSLLPAILFGVAVGNIIQGIPLNLNHDFSGSFLSLLRPFPLAIGITGLLAILIQGMTYAALKSEEGIQASARKMNRLFTLLFAIFLAADVLLALFYFRQRLTNTAAWGGFIFTLAAVWITRKMIRREKDRSAFIFSSLIFAGLWWTAAALLFPNLVIASNNAQLHLSLYNASSSHLTLTVMLIIALLGLPLVLGYTFFVYHAFRGKTRLLP